MPTNTKLVRIKVSTETELLKLNGTHQAKTDKRLSIDEIIVITHKVTN